MTSELSERQRLLGYMDKSRGHFSLALALTRGRIQARSGGEECVSELRSRGCPTELVDFSGAAGDVDLLQRLAAAGQGTEALVVVGFDELLVEDDRPRRTQAVAALNFNRDLLRDRVPVPVVIWLSRSGARALAMLAPDTYDVVRTSFELESGEQVQQATRPELVRRWPRWLRRAPVEERPRVLERLEHLRSLFEDSQGVSAGDLAASLAESHFGLGEVDDGDRWLERAAEQHERAESLGAAVTDRRRRAELRLFRGERAAAREELDKATSLVERILGSDDPVLVARERPDLVSVRERLESEAGHGSSIPDGELLARWQAGSKNAGSELLARHFNTVRVYLLARISESDVSDLLQDVFSKLVEISLRVEPGANIRWMLLGIARRVVLEHYRQRPRGTGGVSFGTEFIELREALGQRLERSEAVEGVLEAMQRLSLHEQEILELRYFHELELSELAELFEVSVPVVESRLRRARRRLAMVYPEPGRILGGVDVEPRLRELGQQLHLGMDDHD